MAATPAALPDVYSRQEIALAAGAPVAAVVALMGARGGRAAAEFVAEDEAIRLVRALRGESGRLKPAPTIDLGRLKPAPTYGLKQDHPAYVPACEHSMFAPAPATRRAAGMPLLTSGALHAGAFSLAVWLSAIGAFRAPQARELTSATVTPVRLVFTAQPGPGGGGGGGGLRRPEPPPKAERAAPARPRRAVNVSSPVPPRRPPPSSAPPPRLIAETPRPPLRAETLPPIVAPVVSVAADARDRAGLLVETGADTDGHGPGTGGGVGTGAGSGIGEGDGAGIGPGSGGGYGGGPYRAGSGIEPPRLVREVKPGYTEEARRAGVEGEVVLEIIVGRDGRVGEVTVLQSLGSGLDRKAIDAVRQWRFEPARRSGTPVDVVVEVAVEFRVR